MQQHSQIVELKDRLQKSIDDSYNVKNINEVTRVISVLERLRVTREDLEKTRLGKTINELRRKTTDKELAKRAKKLIKSWQSLMSSSPAVVNVHSTNTTPNDTNDEDSNSSVFSNLSTDGIALSNGRSLLGSPNAPITANSTTKKHHHQLNASRKRKLESEADSLRENLNSIMISGGRRLQTTQELAQKFNIQIKPSLSANSSPHLLQIGRDDTLSPAKRSKLSNGGTTYKNGFHHNDENSLGDFESATLTTKKPNHRHHHNNNSNKSLPVSPALLSLRNNTSHSATTSPAIQSHSYVDDDNDATTFPKVSIKLGGKSGALLSPAGSDSIDAKATKRCNQTVGRTVSEVDRDIALIYAQLPQIKAEDYEWLEQFKFDNDEPVELEEEKVNGEKDTTTTKDQLLPVCEPQVKDDKIQVDGVDGEDDDEYELFEYNEEYEEMEDEEVEVVVTDEEEEDEDVRSEIESAHRLDCCDNQDEEDDGQSASGVQRPLNTEAFESDVSGSAPGTSHREHTMGDIFNCDKPAASVDDCSGPATVTGGDDLKSGGSDRGTAEPDSIYSCDDSNDAISSSTSLTLKRQEADSTTADEQQPHQSNQRYEDDCVTSTESPTSAAGPTDAFGCSAECVQSDSATATATATAEPLTPLVQPTEQTLAPIDPLEALFAGEDFTADIELLCESCYTDPSNEFYTQFPLMDCFLPPPPELCTSAALLEPSGGENASTEEAEDTAAISSPVLPQPTSLDDSSDSSMEASPAEVPSSPPAEASVKEELLPSQAELPLINAVSESPKPPRPKRWRTKRIVIPVLKKKYRKCVTRSKVKRLLVDRISNDQWENVNGNFDKDGVWHDFGEMTSALVLTGGENASNQEEDNVLHILPYVNYTW